MPLSYENYTGDNVTTTFNIPFTYTATSEISVTVDGVAQTGLTFPSASQVQLTSAPASSTVVQVRRTTDLTSRAVDFASGSVLTEEDLDNANIQIFHSSQEAVDLTDDTIQEDVDSKWDAESKVIKNVANPTNAQDAATKDYLENTWLTPADKAQLNSLNIPNLNTVATNIADVNAVAADATDIGTVSTNIASVNTVATNIADVVTVANDLNEAISEIETAADDLNEAVSDIDTVSTNIANVNTVGGAIANVNTVSGAIANVNTTATNIGNINTVAGISGNVTTVANISANVTAVAGDATDIGTVATNIADVNTVAGNNANINTVAGISANVTSVAGNATNINTVAGINSNVTTVANNNANVTTTATNIANINSVAGNSSNINAVAANETNINSVNSNSANINTVATNISNVNSVGGSIANVNTVATNLASVNNFADVYRIESSAPTTSLDLGDLYFDTTSDTLKVYGASGWQNAGSSINGTSQRYHYDITGTPTSVTGADANGNTLTYDAGYVDVYVNGVRMSTADVTVTSGDTVTFAEALADGDEVDIVGYGTFSVASLNADNLDSGTVPDARITGAYTGITNLTMSGNLTVDTNTLVVNSSTNSVGIGTTVSLATLNVLANSASRGLDVIGRSSDNRSRIQLLNNAGTDVLSQWDYSGTTVDFKAVSNIPLTFHTNASERMRIDSSGNLLVGTTDNQLFDNTSGSGLCYRPSLSLDIARESTSSTSTAILLNNTGVDSRYITFRKDGTDVGSIGVNAGRLYIGSTAGNDSFVTFTGNEIYPATSTGGGRDNAINLGTSGARFKDLYLSGSAQLANITNGAGEKLILNSDNMVFQVQASEKARIDSSGNLLVSKTAGGSGTAGIQLESGGRGGFTKDNAYVTFQNRLSSDGEISRFMKDGTTVGSIQTKDSRLFISGSQGSTPAGIYFGGGGDLLPASTTNAVDNSISLGGTGHRFKNLYLSGGVYLGGTGSANKLDDYEEGTFNTTPMAFETSGTVTMNQHLLRYTKIGSVVTVTGNLHFNVVSSQNGALKIPLPFTSASGTQNRAIGFVGNYETSEIVVIKIENNSSYGTMVTPINWATHTITNSDTRLISFVYHTDS